MRKIGIESGAYFGVCFAKESDFAKMRAHGFDCVDLNLSYTSNEPGSIYHRSDEEFEKILLEIKGFADNNGIEIYQAHGPWIYPPENETPEQREQWKAYTEKSIYGASLVGCKNLVVHPIMPFGPNAEPDSELYYKLNYEFHRSLIPAAEKYGVTICIENMPFGEQSLATPKQIADFADDLKSDVFAVCLDTGHSEIRRVSAADAVRTMGRRIRALHVHDNDGRGDRHECPFFGVIDWEAFRTALNECTDGSVPIMLETAPGSRSIPREVRDALLPGFAAAARRIAR